MNESIYEKFNEKFDIEGLRADIESANKPITEEVPFGNYEVTITKLELGESKKGAPQVKAWFKIVAGDYKGQLIFMNQNITSGFQIHTMNDFLSSLDSGEEIISEVFRQYGVLLERINEVLNGIEYQLEYDENAKGFKTYTIVQKF